MTNQTAVTILKNLEQSLDDYCELNDEGKEAFRMAITALELFGISEQLQSAQPEPQWIPVSERLPGDDTDCLVSIRCQAKVVVVDMATYSTDLFKVDKEDFFGNCGESGWYCFNGEYGYCKVLNVIAWMPLPEPYRADGKGD